MAEKNVTLSWYQKINGRKTWLTLLERYNRRNERMIPVWHTYHAVLRRVYPIRINLLWKQQKASEKIWYSFKTLLLSCIYAEEWIHKLCILYSTYKYTKLSLRSVRTCTYFECISAVNNDPEGKVSAYIFIDFVTVYNTHKNIQIHCFNFAVVPFIECVPTNA